MTPAKLSRQRFELRNRKPGGITTADQCAGRCPAMASTGIAFSSSRRKTPTCAIPAPRRRKAPGRCGRFSFGVDHACCVRSPTVREAIFVGSLPHGRAFGNDPSNRLMITISVPGWSAGCPQSYRSVKAILSSVSCWAIFSRACSRVERCGRCCANRSYC